MKAMKVTKVYIVPDVKEYKDGGLDDLTEQTEAQLDEVKHFQYLLVEQTEKTK